MNRKKPRQVSIEPYEELEFKKFHELYTHAKNSAIWYATNTVKTSFEIKEKLYDKGYPKEEVILVQKEEKIERNIVEEVIEELINLLLIDDYLVAKSVAESKKRMKKGGNFTKFILSQKGIEQSMIEEVIEEVYTDNDELLEYLERELKKELRNNDYFTAKQKVFKRAAGRGWDFDSINECFDKLKEDDESFS